MLLSIVLMIKNEEKFLNNTLKALDNLREQISSELIILDTGSTDKSIEIASKYTDKIYVDKWNDNFADMRNKSISYAKGEWILVIDADEELVRCDRLIEFFSSNLHKKYNSASIDIRNILSEDKKLYSNALNIRMFRNENFRYEGAIHEQPLYKEPLYNNIAMFNHYGYLYTSEKFKQNKLNRNEKILLSQLKKNPNESYLNFQLAKNYMAFEKKEESIYYMEKAFKLYNNQGEVMPFVYSNLAKAYISVHKFDKCEKICKEYIEKDNKNIDIYYYLGLSQNMINKYSESTSNYKKYLYLLENYQISTQANSIYCDGNTTGLKDYAEIDILKNYYILEQYENVIELAKKMKEDQINKLYSIIFTSLSKLGRLEDILDFYKLVFESIVSKEEFELKLEETILEMRESDRKRIYKIFETYKNNYGTLCKVRLGLELTIEEYNHILISENSSYYADLIYFGFERNLDILDITNNLSNIQLQNYFNYIVKFRKKCISNLYEYIQKSKLSLHLGKLKVYIAIIKSLLFEGNFENQEYEELFYMYITYNYEYIRQIYNENIPDEELVNLVNNDEYRFILEFMNIQRDKQKDTLNYIRNIKKILITNPQYKKGINIFIKKIEKELKESKELKELKLKYKTIIEENIYEGNFDICNNLISEYEKIFSNESLDNIKAIISINENDLENAEKWLKRAYYKNKYDEDVLFNIAYIKQYVGEYLESEMFYRKILKISKNIELKDEIIKKLNS